MPISRSNDIPGVAERRAADVSAGRQRLDAGRETLERYRANELAEAEALALARIKADTERALAHQAQTLRDAERAAELVAIERRSTDLEAAKEAQRRQALDIEATQAAAAKAKAERHAEQAALEKKSLLAAAHEKHMTRLNAEREALAAHRDSRRAKLGLAWITLRTTSPFVAGLVMLLLGSGGGWLYAEWRGDLSLLARGAINEEVPLRLDTELSTPAIKKHRQG